MIPAFPSETPRESPTATTAPQRYEQQQQHHNNEQRDCQRDCQQQQQHHNSDESDNSATAASTRTVNRCSSRAGPRLIDAGGKQRGARQNTRMHARTYLRKGVRRWGHEGLEEVHDVPEVPQLRVDVQELGVVPGEIKPRLVARKSHVQADLPARRCGVKASW